MQKDSQFDVSVLFLLSPFSLRGEFLFAAHFSLDGSNRNNKIHIRFILNVGVHPSGTGPAPSNWTVLRLSSMLSWLVVEMDEPQNVLDGRFLGHMWMNALTAGVSDLGLGWYRRGQNMEQL